MNAMRTTVLMALLVGLFMFVGGALAGSRGMMMGLTFAAVTNMAAYWFSDKLALMMSGAQEVSPTEAPDLHRMVAAVARQAGVPMPRVYIIPQEQPNAFATGRDPQHAAVAVTEGLLQVMSREELEAVLAHEMAHVKHRDILISSIAATVAGAISMLPRMFYFFGPGDRRDDDGGGILGMLAAMIIAPIAAMLIQLAISRAREFEADAGAARITGNPLALASALQRLEGVARRSPMHVNAAASHMYIVNPLGGDILRGIGGLFRTHPHTEERVARLHQIAGIR
jgi:heat shock protein HtpX